MSMKTRGYTEGQIRAMQSIMSIAAEWFDHTVLIIKDNKKHFYWQCEGDDDMIEMMAYRAFEEITDADATFPELHDFGDDEPEADYLTDEWADYEEEDDDE